VNYRKLAKKGRFGDNKIRQIDNRPAHVNTAEASLYDRLGKNIASPIIKSFGAGTNNPRTGLKEYHAFGAPGHSHGDGSSGSGGYDMGGTGNEGLDWGDTDWGDDDDVAPGTGINTGDFSEGESGTDIGSDEEDEEIFDLVDDAIDGEWTTFYNQSPSDVEPGSYTGMYGVPDFDQFMQDYSSGALREYASQNYGISSEKFSQFISDPRDQQYKFDTLLGKYETQKAGLYDQFQQSLSSQRSGYENVMRKSNMAFSGMGEYQRDLALGAAEDKFLTDMSGARIGYQEDLYNLREDVIADFYSQINQILNREAMGS